MGEPDFEKIDGADLDAVLQGAENDKHVAAIRDAHDHLVSLAHWDCPAFEAATPDDSDENLVYCAGCGAVLWRDGAVVEPVTRRLPRP